MAGSVLSILLAALDFMNMDIQLSGLPLGPDSYVASGQENITSTIINTAFNGSGHAQRLNVNKR